MAGKWPDGTQYDRNGDAWKSLEPMALTDDGNTAQHETAGIMDNNYRPRLHYLLPSEVLERKFFWFGRAGLVSHDGANYGGGRTSEKHNSRLTLALLHKRAPFDKTLKGSEVTYMHTLL